MNTGANLLLQVLRWAYWLVLGATYPLALWFAVYLFLVGPPLAALLLTLGAVTARWPMASLLFVAVVLIASAIASLGLVINSWGTDAAWAGPFMIWIADAFLIVTFKLGQLYGRRRARRRMRQSTMPHPI